MLTSVDCHCLDLPVRSYLSLSLSLCFLPVQSMLSRVYHCALEGKEREREKDEIESLAKCATLEYAGDKH